MMKWLKSNWHTLCAVLYLMICLTDFVIMPIWYEYSNHLITPIQAIAMVSTLKDGPTQVAALQVIDEQREWTPITLSQSGILHLSFGAILGVGVWARSRNNTAAQLAALTNRSIPGMYGGGMMPMGFPQSPYGGMGNYGPSPVYPPSPVKPETGLPTAPASPAMPVSTPVSTPVLFDPSSQPAHPNIPKFVTPP